MIYADCSEQLRQNLRAADFTVPKCYRAFWTASTNSLREFSSQIISQNKNTTHEVWYFFGVETRDTLRRRFFEHSECYRKNCLTRDFGSLQRLSRHCSCVGELRSISHFHKKIKNHTQGMALYFWRRWRDSNSRTAINSYTISNRAPSTGLGDISVLVT